MFIQLSKLLSIPDSSSQQKQEGEKPDPKYEESLLFRLPPEIRQQIYGLLISSNQVFHIRDHYISSTPAVWAVRSEWDGAAKGLLRANRKLYEEAGTILYAKNTFHFVQGHAFYKFTETLTTESLNKIESLTFKFDLSVMKRLLDVSEKHWLFRSKMDRKALRFWSEMWDTIVRMEELKRIRVHFDGYVSMGGIGSAEWKILEPLSRVRRDLEVFEVEVPWSARLDRNEEAMMMAPFTLRRGIKTSDLPGFYFQPRQGYV